MNIYEYTKSPARDTHKLTSSLLIYLLVHYYSSTVIAAFGLPPIAHEDDAVRGILASLAICAELRNLGPLNISLNPSVGITSGTAFCGVVGHSGNRREYTGRVFLKP